MAVTAITVVGRLFSYYVTMNRADILGADILVSTKHGKQQYVHFDNAATTPSCISALEGIMDLTPYYASVHRGSGMKSDVTTSAYEDARKVIAGFVGANAKEHVVIFTKNTTEAINKLAHQLSFKKGDIVIASAAEHHSNDLPWRRQAIVRYIDTTAEGDVDEIHYLALLRKYGNRVKLVAVTGASNVTGTMPDIHWMAVKAHEVGAQIMVDGAQLVAHKKVDVGRLDDPQHIDFLAFSAHKMYAPFGSGALVARKDVFMHGEPDHVGGGTVQFVTKSTIDWADTPERDEAGTPNVMGAVACARAAQFLQVTGFDKIVKREQHLTRYALTQLQKIPAVTLYGSTDVRRLNSRSCIIPFAVKGMSPHLVSAILGKEYGIGVRSGCFCAQPYVARLLGLRSSEIAHLRSKAAAGEARLLPGLVRVSLSFYNTEAEIDQLIEALHAIASGSFGRYVVEASTGTYVPEF